MPDELYIGAGSINVYLNIHRMNPSTGLWQIWKSSTSAWVSFTVGDIANYAMAATETNGNYVVSVTTSIGTGPVLFVWRQRAGGSVATSDAVLEKYNVIYDSGSQSFVPVSSVPGGLSAAVSAGVGDFMLSGTGYDTIREIVWGADISNWSGLTGTAGEYLYVYVAKQSDLDLLAIDVSSALTAANDTYAIVSHVTYGNQNLKIVLDTKASSSSISTLQGNMTDVLADTNELQGLWTTGGTLRLRMPGSGTISTLDATAVATATQTGMTAQGYTTTRGPYLDKLNVAGTLAHTGNASSFMANVSGIPAAVIAALNSDATYLTLTDDVSIIKLGYDQTFDAITSINDKIDVIDGIVDDVLVDTAAMQATVQAGLTAQGYTSARAGYVDKLNFVGTISTLDGTGVQSALTSQGYTSARAVYVDKLNVAGTLAHTGNASAFMADISALATTSQLNARTLVASGYATATALAALNNLSPTDIANALASYDGPTKAELDSAVALLATASALAALRAVADATKVDTARVNGMLENVAGNDRFKETAVSAIEIPDAELPLDPNQIENMQAFFDSNTGNRTVDDLTTPKNLIIRVNGV